MRAITATISPRLQEPSIRMAPPLRLEPRRRSVVPTGQPFVGCKVPAFFGAPATGKATKPAAGC